MGDRQSTLIGNSIRKLVRPGLYARSSPGLIIVWVQGCGPDVAGELVASLAVMALHSVDEIADVGAELLRVFLPPPLAQGEVLLESRFLLCRAVSAVGFGREVLDLEFVVVDVAGAELAKSRRQFEVDVILHAAEA